MTEKKKQNEVFIDYGRQLDIFDPSVFKENITVIGVGGIGSPTVILLAKMGCPRITVYEPDKVENHNLPSQFFRLSDIGRLKAESSKEAVKDFTGVEMEIKPEFYTNQNLAGIVICAVDSMEARQAAWKKAKYNPAVKLFIDARMGGEVARIYAINPLDIDQISFYEKNLYTDKQASAERCTVKAIIYNTFRIASEIGHLIKRFVKREKMPMEVIIDLPNYTTFVTFPK